MNERLRELAEQATRKYDRLGNDIPFAQPDLELFAELIVRECARISNEADDTMTNQGEASAQAFKEYFGVEE